MNDFTDEMIKEMARKAVREGKSFEYMMFWLITSDGWQKKARKYFLEALKEFNTPSQDCEQD